MQRTPLTVLCTLASFALACCATTACRSVRQTLQHSLGSRTGGIDGAERGLKGLYGSVIRWADVILDMTFGLKDYTPYFKHRHVDTNHAHLLISIILEHFKVLLFKVSTSDKVS